MSAETAILVSVIIYLVIRSVNYFGRISDKIYFDVMPVPLRTQQEKNIWVAAGDGDLDRVRELVEHQSFSPNVPDPNTYTPMHAAASYGHIHVLEYLLSKGGDVNITDDEGDTPLYTVENIETAQFLVVRGATVDMQNLEGVSPTEFLQEDFPEVASYLRSLSTEASSELEPSIRPPQHPSQHMQNIASETLTTSLMQSAHDIIQRAEAEGRDPDEELREVVSRIVLQGVATGYGMTEASEDRSEHDENENKRHRSNGS